MRDYMNIGSSPADEDCVQVSSTQDYIEDSKKECLVFAEQLQRVFSPVPEGAYFSVKGFPHDFGRYYEVVVNYDDDVPASVEFAYNVEGDTPAEWDEIARQRLAELLPHLYGGQNVLPIEKG